MKLGFVSAILPDLSLAEVMEFAADVGFDSVEVMCWPPSKADRRYAGVTHIDVTGFDEVQANQIRELCARTNVEISGLGYYPNPLGPDHDQAAVEVDHIRRVIEASAVLGVNQMNTFVGRDWTATVDENWNRFVDVWRPIVDYASERNVRIGIENCPMLFTNDEWPGGKNLATSPAIWRRMFHDIPNENFGLNFDPSHLVWQHMDYLKPLFEFRDRISHVHAKDVRIDRQGLDDHGIMATPLSFHTPKLPGLGEIEWGKFCSVLGETGYTGHVAVEVEDRTYEGSLTSRQDALRQSHRYLRNFIP